MSVIVTEAEAYELHQAAIAHVRALEELCQGGANEFVRQAARISLPIAESARNRMRELMLSLKGEGSANDRTDSGTADRRRPYATRHGRSPVPSQRA